MRSLRLEYDRDYGIDHRSGWTAVYDGRVVVQLTSLWRAVWHLCREWFRREEDDA